jgi:cytochrome c556
LIGPGAGTILEPSRLVPTEAAAPASSVPAVWSYPTTGLQENGDMQRKWFVLAGSMVAGLVVCAGLSSADDEGPLHELMEKVNRNNAIVTKATKSETKYKKAHKDVVKAAEELVKLGKESKPIKDAAKAARDVKDAEAKWDAMMDDFIKASEELAKVVGDAKTTVIQAKSAHTAVRKSCTPCHEVFRVEE